MRPDPCDPGENSSNSDVDIFFENLATKLHYRVQDE